MKPSSCQQCGWVSTRPVVIGAPCPGPPIQISSQNVQWPPSSLPRRPQCPTHWRKEWTTCNHGCSSCSYSCSHHYRPPSGNAPTSRLWSTALRGPVPTRIFASACSRRGADAYAHAITRWLLPSTSWPLCPPNARAVWPRAWSVWSTFWNNCHHPGTSGGCHNCHRPARRDVPVLASADCMSALPAGHCHSYLPRCGPHEHTLLSLLLLCWVWSWLLLDSLSDWWPEGCDTHLPQL